MKRISRFLVFSLLVVLLACTAIAEDGDNCMYCGAYRFGDWLCECGLCSIEAEPADCWAATHCWECGDCFNTRSKFCTECHLCDDCYIAEVCHCMDCEECYAGDRDALCSICWFCESCAGAFCDDCGRCESCQEFEGGVHCPECDNCYNTYGACEEEGAEHCKECCLTCEKCERCVFDDGLELCDECGACEECCEAEAQSEGCECGEYCVEGSDWYDHICLTCGTPFCTVDQCEICEVCLDCCEGNSDCSEGLCAMDDEYDEHFCNDCGACFHDVDVCEICFGHGELRCEDCCHAYAEDEGCDCGDTCVSDPDFDMHVLTKHSEGGEHSAKPQSTWSFDETYHYVACRYCDSAAHLTAKAKHTLNKYDICTVCGYNTHTKILILAQPHSRVVNVSDNEADAGEPYNIEDNKVSFSVFAKGNGTLRYQWYERYGNGKWTALEDDTNTWNNGKKFSVVHGAKTEKLTISVPTSVCYEENSYRCEITDEEGNTVYSAEASILSRHIYKNYTYYKGALIGIIRQPNKNNNIGVYESKLHEISCLGDGCEAVKEEPHNFGKAEGEVTDSVDGSVWTKFTCRDCGFTTYIKNHDHYFLDKETGECVVDYTYKNGTQHRLKCLYDGCTKTTLESHTWLAWGNQGTPHSSPSGIGAPYKECSLCSYTTTQKPMRFDSVKEVNVATDWTKANDLVYVQYGYASSDIYVMGDSIEVTFAPTVNDKSDYIKMTNPRCLAFRVYYTGNGVTDLDVTGYATSVKLEGEPKWRFTIKSFQGYTGGGTFTFVPAIDKAECKHESGTRIFGAYKPVCVKDGYTGDLCCCDCGYVVKYGEAIEGGTEHTGTLTLIKNSVVEATCETRGYEGSYKCSHCGMKVLGDTTPRKHTGKITVKNAKAASCFDFGYTGDTYCSCGDLVKEGKLIAPTHTKLQTLNYVEANCLHDGYTGDVKCAACGIYVKYGYTQKGGEHAFSDWKAQDGVNHRSYCMVSGCNEFVVEPHTDADRDLVCDICNYSLGEDGEYISSIVLSVAAPEIGAKADYTKFDTKRFYSDDLGDRSGKYTNGISWVNTVTGKKISTFEEGGIYKLTVCFRSNLNYSFAENLTASVNGIPAVAEYLGPDFASIEVTFPKLDHAHEYTLMRNESSHHYECLVCGVVKDAGNHVFDANGRCKTCGYNKSGENPFTDVKASDYYFEAVLWALEEQVTVGTSATTFSPTATCTRGQVVTFLWRAAGCPEPKASPFADANAFTDVKTTDYYYKPVLWAVEKGITVGTSATKFSPNDTCSSAHIITFLYRAMGIGTNGWYEAARDWAKGADLLGKTGLSVTPAEPCPRSAVVTFLYRFYEK